MIPESARLIVRRGIGVFAAIVAVTLLTDRAGSARIVPGATPMQHAVGHALDIFNPDATVTYVYVSNPASGNVTVYKQFGNTYTQSWQISGLSLPAGIAYSANKLYVSSDGEVPIFAKGKPPAGETLNDGTALTQDVAVTSTGTVLVANPYVGYDSPGDIEVYVPGQAPPSCTAGETCPNYAVKNKNWTFVYSIALNSKNDLFVGYIDISNVAHIEKFVPKLGKYVRGTDTGYQTTSPNGMTFDANDNLLVDDATKIDVFTKGQAAGPPANSFGTFVNAQFLAFNSTGKLLFIADSGAGPSNQGAVEVYSYTVATHTGTAHTSFASTGATGVAVSPPAPL